MLRAEGHTAMSLNVFVCRPETSVDRIDIAIRLELRKQCFFIKMKQRALSFQKVACGAASGDLAALVCVGGGHLIFLCSKQEISKSCFGWSCFF